MEKEYRRGLPSAMPHSIQKLPEHRGYPVPWFVASVNGVPDFRLVDSRKIKLAVEKKLCWVCGQPLSHKFTFIVGPMCAINRISAEPPSHPSCANWTAHACPFLIQKEAERREAGLPADTHLPPGDMIMRQPGVVLLWDTNSYEWVRAGEGKGLFRMGGPLETFWLREGRPATRAEVERSIREGLPALRERAASLSELRQIERDVSKAMTLLPTGGNDDVSK